MQTKPARSRLELCETLAQYRSWRDSVSPGTDELRSRIGFVPTMGALHDGHLSLMARARQECDKVVVSIFVNPLQFAPHEDFGRYPRPFERDLSLCEQAGVDALLHPAAEEIYGADRQNVTRVVPPDSLTSTMEGAFRPGFFTGVATVVCKLFNIVRADVAYFGEKDYQQLQVITKMVADLNLPVTIVPVPTMREADGLAMSSRNVYLNPDQRRLAPLLHATLDGVKTQVLAGNDVSGALKSARERLAAEPGVELQYLELVDAASLVPLSKGVTPFVVLVAAKLGDVRLIDNIVVR
jgi:pantoate--beta-alanine ligase